MIYSLKRADLGEEGIIDEDSLSTTFSNGGIIVSYDFTRCWCANVYRLHPGEAKYARDFAESGYSV
jgi:hypothetical protein